MLSITIRSLPRRRVWILMSSLLCSKVHRRKHPPLTAEALLHQSAASEEMLAGHADQVIHRTIDLEERRVARLPNEGDELIAHRRVEVWESAEKGVTARRLFDEKDQLIAGDWRRA